MLDFDVTMTRVVKNTIYSVSTSKYPFGCQRRVFSTFDQNFDFKKRKKGAPKKFSMSAAPMSR